jgi:hypothetical protein
MIYSYADTLLDKWIEWSESFLSKKLLSETNDLNNILGTSGSDNPSRAVEFFNIGLLDYPLTASNFAYDSLRADKPVHSAFGYISFLLSKAKSIDSGNEKINTAFKSICSICLVQQYEEFDKGKLSLNSILQYLLDLFPIPDGCDEKKYLRYLSAAMFCELYTNKQSIYTKIINKELIELKIIERDTKVIRARFNNSNNILDAIDQKVSLTGIEYEKGSVFFIGDPKKDNPRGLFYLSYSKHNDFLQDCYLTEIKEILSSNPFEELFEKKSNYDIITSINKILSKDNKNINYLKVMKSLEEGCIEALKVLGWDEKDFNVNDNLSFNRIFYGSPGTGKSREVNNSTKGYKRTRITFHPETDYHSFVGSYKPVMEGINIKYDFVPQAFTKAYCNAWLNPSEPYYLIIEEINRGNCAQIFGDIFQCLDRDNTGKSEYGIDCDKDLAKYLKGKFEKDASPEILENYKNVIESEDFDKIILPSNLYIYATMNTSDQSLFPMDSAFKRRWDMKFVPVDYEDANSLIISLDDDTVYNWGNFIFNINPKIKELTGSEDKQLGNRFINPSDGKITFEQFRSKVLFYLWSEIYKDEVGSLNSIFKYQILEEDPIEFQFGELFEEREGSITQIDLFKGFMHFNGIETISNK